MECNLQAHLEMYRPLVFTQRIKLPPAKAVQLFARKVYYSRFYNPTVTGDGTAIVFPAMTTLAAKDGRAIMTISTLIRVWDTICR
jgi:hypothetical protein